MTSDEAKPWWASGGPAGGGIDREVDPIEAHRSARRGGERPIGGSDADEPFEASTGPAPARDRATGSDHAPDVCGVCPICIGLRMLGEVRPDLVTHLTEAARHLTAAARTLFEAAAAEQDHDRPGAPPRGGVTRIDLD
jgi:hypothetical protein